MFSKNILVYLQRLGFNPEITNLDGLGFAENKKFDIILLDSPCSSIGTIRKHPEILFKSKEPTFSNLEKIQTNLLQKSSRLVKNNGKIIYMVCSFFHLETTNIVNKFLENNKNFTVEKFNVNKEIENIENFITKEGYFLTAPTKYKNHYIDGFFSVQLIRND